MIEEWGQWIEHDGTGCPCVGKYCHMVGDNNAERFGIAMGGRSWDWSNVKYAVAIIRYRIRRPRALLQLIEMVENLPAPSKQYEDA